MKQIPIQLQAHYEGYATTTCTITRFKTRDGQLIGLTDADHTIDYDAAPAGPDEPGDDYGMMSHKSDNGGISLSNTEAAADLMVGNAEMTTILSDEITPEKLLAGMLDGAEVHIYRINYMDLSQGHELVDFGYADAARMEGKQVVVAFRSMSDLLKEPQAVLWSKSCDHEFGGPKCPKEFVWVEGTVLVPDVDEPARVFTSTISASDDFYRPGVVKMTSGANIGREMEVAENVGGTFALSLDFDYDLAPGDTFEVRQHCSKVYDDAEHGCLYWWGVVDRNLYHGGCPDIPTGDGGSSMVPGNGLVSDDDD